MSQTLDNFLGGRINLLQPHIGYRAGIDPLFLSASLQINKEEKVLDVGCGVGTAAIALAFRCPQSRIIGLELQLNLCELAHVNVKANNFVENITIVQGDILCPPADIRFNTFDHVMTNPPYYKKNKGQSSPFIEKVHTNIETMNLGEWIKNCLKFLKPKGIFTIIHRAERLQEILYHLSHSTGDMVVYPLWPASNKAARRIIIQARKNTGGDLRLAQGIILHDGIQKYTAEAEAVLRHAKGIIL